MGLWSWITDARDFIFYDMGSFRPRTVFWVAVVTIGTLVCGALDIGLMADDLTLTTQRDTRIYFESKESYKTLRRGETLRLLGYEDTDHRYVSDGTFWVETEGGDRGFVSISDLDNRFISFSKREKAKIAELDTFTITGKYFADKGDLNYTYHTLNSKGEKGTVKSLHGAVSVTVQEHLYNYKVNSATKQISLAAFEHRCMGDSIFRDGAFTIRNYRDSTVVKYQLEVYDAEKQWFFSPTVVYVDGVAERYRVDETTGRNGNAWALSYFPMADAVIDHLGWLVQDSCYDSTLFSPVMVETQKWVYAVILIFVLLVLTCGSLWLFASGLVVSNLIYGMMAFPQLTRWMGNKVGFGLILLAMLVGTYCWIILLLTYGLLWWIAIPVVLFIAWRFLSIYHQLVERPCLRCEQCKHIDTKGPNGEREYVGTSYEREQITQPVGSPSYYKRTERIATTTTTITRNGYGVETSRTSSTDHRDVDRQYKRQNYQTTENRYQVDTYRVTCECECCGRKEYVYECEYTMTGSKDLGTHHEDNKW